MILFYLLVLSEQQLQPGSPDSLPLNRLTPIGKADRKASFERESFAFQNSKRFNLFGSSGDPILKAKGNQDSSKVREFIDSRRSFVRTRKISKPEEDPWTKSTKEIAQKLNLMNTAVRALKNIKKSEIKSKAKVMGDGTIEPKPIEPKAI